MNACSWAMRAVNRKDGEGDLKPTILRTQSRSIGSEQLN